MEKESNLEEQEKDKCVVCKRKTPYTKDTPIDERLYYIEGAGQLCKNCHERIYK